ncbi:MAG: OmpA family protein [Deltaproteobacteria bacterium]|nr:OmpA family protein [Deltaproteobacteria bacterium]
MSDEQQSKSGEIPDWVVTFADLMTLLFCFFVLLTTLSTQPKNCNGLQQYLDQNQESFKNYELRSSKLECIVSLPSDFLFKSGGDQIQSRAFRALIPLFRKIQELEEHKSDILIVEGHTDNVPIRTRKFPSNWELSSARATNVATFLVNRMKFPDDMVSVSAFADNKPKVEYIDDFGVPMKGNALRNARGINRRVEIILVKRPESRSLTRLLFSGE